MGNTNQRKAETLGMPGGTANNRLRKILIYALLHTVAAYRERFGPLEYPGSTGDWPIRAWGLHCHVCHGEIKSPDDMTIEHIQPWEGRPNGKDLFWDLENIAFSHKRCNQPHSRPGQTPRFRRVGPEGTAWCSGHQEFLPIEKFHKDANHWNGVGNDCKECRARNG